jgi:ethanolamine utilization protein EutN
MADTVQSGPGDIIFWVGSREAALAMPETFVPIDAAIVGHVDAVGGTRTLPSYEER